MREGDEACDATHPLRADAQERWLAASMAVATTKLACRSIDKPLLMMMGLMPVVHLEKHDRGWTAGMGATFCNGSRKRQRTNFESKIREVRSSSFEQRYFTERETAKKILPS